MGRISLLIVAVVLEIGSSMLSPHDLEFCTSNIPDFYIVHDVVLDTFLGAANIFTLPSVSPQCNCSNNVTAIHYCYHATGDLNERHAVFDFLHITRDNLLFTFNGHFTVRSSLENANCMQQSDDSSDCCDTFILPPGRRFHIPSTFGVRAENTNRKLLAIPSSAVNIDVEQFRTPVAQGSVNLSTGGEVNMPIILMLRFVTQYDPVTNTGECPSFTSISSSPMANAVPSTVAPPNIVPSTSSPVAAPSTSLPVTTPSTLSTSNLPTDSPPSSTQTMSRASSLLTITLGGALGGVVIAVLLVGLVIVLCVLIAIGRRRLRKENVIQEHKGMSLGNATYDGVGLMVNSSGIPYQEYSYVGPEVAATAKETSKEPQNVQHGQSGPSYETPVTSHSKPAANSHYEVDQRRDEDIYQVPAKDESALYAQLQDIRTHNLSRHLVRLGDVLGSGQFGTVYKGVLDSGGGEVEVAVKTLKEGSGEEDRVKFLQEAAIMGQFIHHNVVEMFGVVTLGEPILLVLELLSKGDLRGHLLHMKANEEGGVSADDHTLLSYCRQVASGMAYLSNKAFVHRDLAARNVLVSDDEICKIADFGMSRDLMDESYYVSHGGMIPVKWTAPEALHFKKYSTASDVWSYGTLMYEIWSVGHKPFATYANNKVIKLVDTGYRLPPPPGCPRALYNIMISCWHPETSGRPSFQDLTRQLSLPDTKLLKWSEEDKSVHPEAAQLGADLLCGEELYTDLQTKYKNF